MSAPEPCGHADHAHFAFGGQGVARDMPQGRYGLKPQEKGSTEAWQQTWEPCPKRPKGMRA